MSCESTGSSAPPRCAGKGSEPCLPTRVLTIAARSLGAPPSTALFFKPPESLNREVPSGPNNCCTPTNSVKNESSRKAVTCVFVGFCDLLGLCSQSRSCSFGGALKAAQSPALQEGPECATT